MRLVSLHIEHFGKIADYTLDFEPGLNVIARENGWGKSTLAAFIRVMLFGFSGELRRNELENERRRYRPWDGRGVYGGTLTFEEGGRRYRIERIFGQREKEDSFRLYDADTNLPSDAFRDPPGEELFRIDRDSFTRTVFAGQMALSTKPTSSIHAKIGQLPDAEDDVRRYEAVRARLDQTLDRLSPDRKTGLISRRREEAAAREEALRGRDGLTEEADRIDAELEESLGALEAARGREAVIEKRQEQLSRMKDLQGMAMRYDALCEAEREAHAALEEAGKCFPGEIPRTEEVEEALRLVQEAAKAGADQRGAELTGDERELLTGLVRTFHAGVPSEKRVRAMEEKADEAWKMGLWLTRHQLTDEEEERRREGEARFSAYLPEDEETARMLSLCEDLWREQSAARADRASAAILEEQQQKSAVRAAKRAQNTAGRVTQAFALLGILCIAAAAFLYLRGIAWWPAPAAGAPVLILAGILIGRSIRNRREPVPESARLEEIRGVLDGREDRIGEMEKTLDEFFARCGIGPEEENRVAILSDLRRDASEYKALRNRRRLIESVGYEHMLPACEQELRTFYSSFYREEAHDAADWRPFGPRLREDIRAYRQLTEKQQGARKLRMQARDNLREVKEMLARWGLEAEEDLSGQLMRVRDRVIALSRLRGEAEEASGRRRAFEETDDFKGAQAWYRENAQGGGDSIAELNAERNALEAEEDRLIDRIALLRRRKEEIEASLRQMDEESEALERCREELAGLEEKRNTLLLVRDYMEKAMRSFTARYMAPIREAFAGYYRMLTGSERVNYSVDADLSVSVLDGGSARDPELLSAGYRDLVGLCTRMAMMDAMYPDKKPFVVFDDPFVNLDDEKQRLGMEFLRKISGDYQVIYFTCHELACYSNKNI